MSEPPKVDFHFRRPPDARLGARLDAELRELRVARSADAVPYWLVWDPEYAEQVLCGEDFRSIIQGDGGVPIRCPETGAPLRAEQTLLASDGAEHARLKAVLVGALEGAGPTMEAFEQRAGEAIAGLRPRGSCEFLSDFAYPVSNWATSALLGLPASEFDELSEEIDLMMAALARALVDRSRYEHIMDRLIHRIWRAQSEGGSEGVAARLGRARLSGRLSAVEALSLCVSVIQGMSRTAAALAAGALRMGLARADDAAVNAHMARTWIEEILHRSPPIHSLLRVAADGAELCGYKPTRGTPVVVCLRALADAQPAKTWAFGHGPHACPSGRLGQAMAERMAVVTLENLPGLRLDVCDAGGREQHHPIFSGPARLSLRWSAVG